MKVGDALQLDAHKSALERLQSAVASIPSEQLRAFQKLQSGIAQLPSEQFRELLAAQQRLSVSGAAMQQLQQLASYTASLKMADISKLVGAIGVTQLAVPDIGRLQAAMQVGSTYKALVSDALQESVRKQLFSVAESISQDRERWEALLAPISSVARAQLAEQLQAIRQVANDSPGEVEAAVREAASQALDTDTVEGVYQRFNAFLSGLDPAKQLLITLLLMPILVSLVQAVINPVTDHYIKRWLADSPQGLQKDAEKAVVQAIGGVQVLADYRLVVAKTLQVKASPAAAGKRIGVLYFGSAVRLVRKEGAFSFIEWKTEDGALVSGWVYSRYLKKFE